MLCYVSFGRDSSRFWKTFGRASASTDAEPDRAGGRPARNALKERFQPRLLNDYLNVYYVGG